MSLQEPSSRNEFTTEELDELRSLVTSYEEAYLETMRNEVSRYQDVVSSWPEFFQSARHVVIVIAVDGVLVIHYPNSEDAIEVHDNEDWTVRQAAAYFVPNWKSIEQGMKSTGFDIDNPPKKYYQLQIRKPGSPGETASSSTSHRHLDDGSFLTLTIGNSFDKSIWGSALGHSEASVNVLELVAGSLMGIVPTGETLNEFGAKVQAGLAHVIEDFKRLLDEDPKESEIQKFLEENPIILSPDYEGIEHQFELCSEYVADFVLTLVNERYVLVEIEPASHPLYTKKGDETHQLKHAEKQVLDWKQWVEETPDYARKHFPGITDPDGWVVIGRRPRDRKNRRSLDRKNRSLHGITILTYDDLIDRTTQLLANLESRT